jgi:hypothetical protein
MMESLQRLLLIYLQLVKEEIKDCGITAGVGTVSQVGLVVCHSPNLPRWKSNEIIFLSVVTGRW